MNAKLSILSTLIIALYIAIPIFRPILVSHNLVPVIYILFAASLLILAFNFRASFIYCDKIQLLFLIGYSSTSLLTTLISDTPSISHIGLMLFLSISFLLGVILSQSNKTHLFFLTLAALYIPISIYILIQVSKSGFSYNTYYEWSNSSYKIDYLTSSMFGVILFIYFSINGKNILDRTIIPILSLIFVMTSGARFSIIFSVIALIPIAYVYTKKSSTKSFIVALFLAPITFALFFSFYGYIKNEALHLSNYSILRMTSLFHQDNSVSGRLDIYSSAIEVISSNLVTGVGAGGSGKALNSNYPHNVLVEAFIDGGFFSAIFILGFLIRFISLSFNLSEKNRICFFLISAYLLGSYLKSFSIYESRILFFFIGYCSSLFLYQKSADFHKKHAINRLINIDDELH